MSIGLIISVSACGQVTSMSQTDHSTPITTYTLSPTPSSAPNTSEPQLGGNPATSANISGLLDASIGGIGCQPWVVAASVHNTIDTGTLLQMKSYLSKVVAIPDGQDALIDTSAALPPAPPGLKMITASIVGQDSIYLVEEYGLDPNQDPPFGCATSLTLTNVSHENIQLADIGVVYASNSIANTQAYHLVDYCTFEACSPCPGCGSGYGCTLYVSFNLPNGPAGTRLDAPVRSDNSDACSIQPTLDPGQSTAMLIELNSQNSQIYHIDLAADIVTSQGSQRLTFPESFDSSVVFAMANQFTCFGLQGNALAQEASPPKPSCI